MNQFAASNPSGQRSSILVRLSPTADALLRIIVDVALTLHLVAAAAFWWLSPKGFPYGHCRFWTNSVLPIAAIVVAGCGLAGMYYQRRQIASLAVLWFAAAWGGAAVTSRVDFPLSLSAVSLLGMIVAVVGFALSLSVARGKSRSLRTWLPSAAIGVFVGVFVVWSQIPPPSSTNPINEVRSEIPGSDFSPASIGAASGEDGIRFDPSTAKLSLSRGNVLILCSPLLEFDRISPDGFWSLFAPRRAQIARRRYVGRATSAGVHNFRYSDGSKLLLPTSLDSETVELTAYIPIASETFSHLNSFCILEISGHKKPSLAFSPCRATKIEVLPADYPTGRPARFAYMVKSGQFNVVEATSGEKGPFQLLATAPMQHGEPLAIEVYDDGEFTVAIEMSDWSQQASTDLSPTAGWGVPMNAIEFQRLGDNPESRVSIWITLAATSVGRGWDTVGHRAGTYRNQMAFRLAP